MSNQETIDGANIVVDYLHKICKKLSKNIEDYDWSPYHPSDEKPAIIEENYTLRIVVDGERKDILFGRERLEDTVSHNVIREETERYIEDAISK